MDLSKWSSVSLVLVCLGYSRQDSSCEWQEKPDAYLWSKHMHSTCMGSTRLQLFAHEFNFIFNFFPFSLKVVLFMFIVFFSPVDSEMGILQPLCLSYGNHYMFSLLSLQQLFLFWSSVTLHWPRCAVRLLEWHLFLQTGDLVPIYWNIGCCPALAAENMW